MAERAGGYGIAGMFSLIGDEKKVRQKSNDKNPAEKIHPPLTFSGSYCMLKYTPVQAGHLHNAVLD
jgi:hypothetical protein